jgi:DNA-binding transcriptional ArsR family regulator
MLKYSEDELSQGFSALADPTRRGMVVRLSRSPASVTQLARPLPISLPAVVQHLAVLEAAGLIETAKVGRVRTCQLRPDRLELLEAWLHGRRGYWQSNLDRLGALLVEDTESNEEQK